MNFALISDIHANLIALEAVLADIERAGVDQIVFLGDLVTMGPQPRQVTERIRDLGCPCVLGNHSVGLAFETMPPNDEPVLMPWAEYGILTWENGRLPLPKTLLIAGRRALAALSSFSTGRITCLGFLR